MESLLTCDPSKAPLKEYLDFFESDDRHKVRIGLLKHIAALAEIVAIRYNNGPTSSDAAV